MVPWDIRDKGLGTIGRDVPRQIDSWPKPKTDTLIPFRCIGDFANFQKEKIYVINFIQILFQIGLFLMKQKFSPSENLIYKKFQILITKILINLIKK